MVSHKNQRNPVSYNEDINPCIKERELVNGCLVDHDYDNSKCEYYFANFRQCKIFWAAVETQRRRAQIKPAMPDKAEREKIMQERRENIQRLKNERSNS